MSRPTHAPALGGEQVEGYHAVRELLSAGRRRARRLWLAAPERRPAHLVELAHLADAARVPVQWRSPEALVSVARTSAPQGAVAWAEPVKATPLEQMFAGPVPFLVLLDGVTDPGNFGSILRSAACAGATGVVTTRHRAAPLTPAAVKAAAGAVEHVALAVAPGAPAALAEMARAGLWSVGLAADGPEDLWALGLLERPLTLVLGGEGSGLSSLSRRRCDVVARVPQVGPLSSLNVSVAAALACFEVARRRAGGPLGRPHSGGRPGPSSVRAKGGAGPLC